MEYVINILTAAVAFCAVIGPAVFIHEFGHFLFAKKFGVKVYSFSIGFGPKICSWTRNGTEYRLSWIPLGGYVKMAGEDPAEEREGTPDEFCAKPVWQRAIIILAGPAANILLAFLLAIGIFMHGMETSGFQTKIGYVNPDGVAANLLREGERILSIDGRRVNSWMEIEKIVRKAAGRPLRFQVQGESGVREVVLTPREFHPSPDADWLIKAQLAMEKVLLGNGTIDVLPWVDAIVGGTRKKYPAARAGIRKGDRIIQINDTPIIQWRDLSREIGNSKGDTCRFIIERQGETMAFLIQPKTQYSQGPNGEISSKYIIGINAVTVPAPRGFLRSVGSATFWTIRMMRMVVVMIHGLLTGDISLKLLAGPLGIAQGSGHSFREGGVSELIRYLALISVNLGAVNLFPIPLLDGGWLFIFLLYEAIRRKPLSQKVQERLMQAGFVFLILLFLVITYNDIGRILDIQSIDQIMAAKKK